MENLEIYIDVARKHGAYPVLITPLERRCFVDEKHLGIGAHSDYVAAMKQIAQKCNVPLVDLYSLSRSELKRQESWEGIIKSCCLTKMQKMNNS